MPYRFWGLLDSCLAATVQGAFNFEYDSVHNTYTDIPITSLGFSIAVSGINNSGWLIGNDPTLGLGYVFNGTALTTINDPLAIGGTTTVLGINNLGEVVGNWKDSNFNTGGFTYDAVNNIFINDNIGVPATYVAPQL